MRSWATAPPSAEGRSGCTAFSTSGWRMRVGTSASSARLDVHLGDEPVLEADLLDAQVAIEQVQLVAERDQLRVVLLQDPAEELAQLREGADRGTRLAGADERGHGVEGIEEEVRPELHLQRAEMGPRQLGLQLRGPEPALGGDAVGVHRLADNDEEPVAEGADEQLTGEAAVQPTNDQIHRRGSRRARV